ncbi:MAG: hypothetical protein QOG67_3381 [Verrucomicrobiota bacterium]|jgi:hypothetical protein
MKGLSAGLTFVNISTVCAVIFGIIGSGLGLTSATLSLALGAVAAVVAFFTTIDSKLKRDRSVAPPPEPKLSKRAQRRLGKTTPESRPAQTSRYRSVLFWLLAGCFAIFAIRSFCWLLYIDGNELKIQSVNNLGDLALHITYIKTFANGIALWPDNPIYVFSKLRYPAGVDLFNGVLSIVHFDLLRILVWTGLLASLATFYAFYRWGGTFGVAGFLFNGGLAGFQLLNTWQFLDYQGDKTIAWKSIPLSMFVTQRGLLYSIPAGLILLWHWRETFFRHPARIAASAANALPAEDGEPRVSSTVPQPTVRFLPFWVELSLYAAMPLFHVHTFLALTIVLIFLFGLEWAYEGRVSLDFVRRQGLAGFPPLLWHPSRWKDFLGSTRIRAHVAALVGCALLPATFFVWLITDHFNAKSMLKWHPGWVQNTGDFKMPFFTFWWTNFGIWVPVVLVLLASAGWRAWKDRNAIGQGRLPEDVAFLSPAVAILLFGLLVKTAPWEWDNLKLIFWAYFLVLPFLWTDLIRHWSLPIRVALCLALFGSGFVSLFGGLTSPGYGFANRGELAGVGVAVRNLPLEARFAAYPTYNHPILLQGRKAVLGYPGHLWTQGFDNYHAIEVKLGSLMRGEPNWRQTAQELGVRYIFWGREEDTNYPVSTKPWAHLLPKVASGDWGTIYDCGKPQER